MHRCGDRSGLRAAVGAVLLALSGCNWFSSSSSSDSAPAVPACPSAVVLRPLANTVVFGPGPGRGPDNVAFYGLLSDVQSKCETSGDSVRVKLEVVVVGERGLVAKGNDLDLNYFVAVVGVDQSILARPTLAVHITIPDKAKRAGVSDVYQIAIPLSGRPAGELTIDLGFLQSPDVVEFYKHYRGR